MRRFYEKEWHGIPFDAFCKMSATDIAGAQFYDSFYDAFFKKYESPDKIDPKWVEFKLQAADLLKGHEKFGKEADILSIGCGLGTVEEALIKDGYSNLEVTEVSEAPLKWLAPHIDPRKVHIGFFPDCIAANKLYDLIYLSSAEYFFDRDQLVDFLKTVSKRLKPGGVCILISVSLESDKPLKLVQVKSLVKFILDKTGIRKRGQFFGYTRTRGDFYDVMSAAGFKQIKDGSIDKKTRWDAYWIEGKTQA
ncbi:MAG: class I SAM-dependent methyltransferase [Candidatus Omnitrophica bacterium]|nr:class I SAM-dependent methyltransferase [Candidatus Omnitrophota bacterium]